MPCWGSGKGRHPAGEPYRGEEPSPQAKRRRTRALGAALSFVANEFRATGSVRLEAITLLESSLRLTGRDGAEHRAILATRIGFLRHVLPDWVEAKRELIFGGEAPEGLGQLMMVLSELRARAG